MSSWRDQASQGAQDDLDELVVVALQAAEHLLDSQGGFLPFGAYIDLDGEVRLAQGDPELGEHPPTDAVIDTLMEGLRTGRDDLRSAALVTDVLMNGSDAVRVELEHRDGLAIQVLMPYRLKRVSGGLERGDLIAQPGTSQVWEGNEPGGDQSG